MLEKFAELLAGFIVEKVCAKFGINNAADLEAFLARVIRAELPDMTAIDALPATIAATVTAQLSGLVTQINGLPAQITATLRGFLPKWP